MARRIYGRTKFLEEEDDEEYSRFVFIPFLLFGIFVLIVGIGATTYHLTHKKYTCGYDSAYDAAKAAFMAIQNDDMDALSLCLYPQEWLSKEEWHRMNNAVLYDRTSGDIPFDIDIVCIYEHEAENASLFTTMYDLIPSEVTDMRISVRNDTDSRTFDYTVANIDGLWYLVAAHTVL